MCPCTHHLSLGNFLHLRATRQEHAIMRESAHRAGIIFSGNLQHTARAVQVVSSARPAATVRPITATAPVAPHPQPPAGVAPSACLVKSASLVTSPQSSSSPSSSPLPIVRLSGFALRPSSSGSDIARRPVHQALFQRGQFLPAARPHSRTSLVASSPRPPAADGPHRPHHLARCVPASARAPSDD